MRIFSALHYNGIKAIATHRSSLVAPRMRDLDEEDKLHKPSLHADLDVANARTFAADNGDSVSILIS